MIFSLGRYVSSRFCQLQNPPKQAESLLCAFPNVSHRCLGLVSNGFEDEALNDAIDELIAQMARVEPDLLQEEAQEVIARTVEDLLRKVGTVDPPTPRF